MKIISLIPWYQAFNFADKKINIYCESFLKNIYFDFIIKTD